MATRRRQKGTGGLKLRGRIWWMRYLAPDGTRKEESSGVDNRAVAHRMLQDKVSGHSPVVEITPASSGIMVDELLNDLEAHYLLHEKRKGGSKSLMKTVRAFFQGWTAEKAIHGMNTYASHRRSLDKAHATINREVGIVLRAFSLAKDAGKVSAIPLWKPLTPAAPREGFLTAEEFPVFRGLLPPQYRLPFTLAFYTGMRFGEVVKLEWKQVDWKARIIRLRDGETKNNEGRLIPLDFEDLYEQLKAQHRQHIREYPFSPWVCTYWNSTKGGRAHAGRKAIVPGDQLKSITVSKGWKDAVKAFGKPLIFHDLRRTAVKHFEESAVPRKIAMAITGHKTESVYRRYHIVNEGDLQQAARKVTEGLKYKGQIGDNGKVRGKRA